MISDDTRFNENLIRQSQDVDVLIHETVAAAPLRAPFVQRQFGYHTSPDDPVDIFGETKPKMAVLTHFVLLGNSACPAQTAKDVMKEIRKKEDAGPAVAGTDLMRIDIEANVTVILPAQKN